RALPRACGSRHAGAHRSGRLGALPIPIQTAEEITVIYLALSSDGNVGKTTLARFVLKPLLPASRLVEVEQVGVEDENAQRTLVIRDAIDAGRPALTA